jgi:DNA invertase Pin-like site-specific DNA recombinase
MDRKGICFRASIRFPLSAARSGQEKAAKEESGIHERQREGIAAAKAKGKHWGHFRAVPAAYAEYCRRVDKGELTVAQAVKELGISRRTWYNLKTA